MALKGRREDSKARTRAAILVAAIERMDAEGFRATTMAHIAEAADVSVATVFNYFPTKASILFGDNHLWRPPKLTAPGTTPQDTVLQLVVGMLNQPDWTRPVDDRLALIRFRLVQQEPDLQREQLAAAMVQVPAFAEALHALHPDVPVDTCVLLCGSAIGAIISAVTFGETKDLRNSIIEAASHAMGCPRTDATLDTNATQT